MQTAETLHDMYVWKLAKELSGEYDNVHTHVSIRGNTRVLGEIDILAKKDGETHVFEVKKSFRPVKAKKQFRNIQKHFGRRIHKFFMYCAQADQVVEIAL